MPAASVSPTGVRLRTDGGRTRASPFSYDYDYDYDYIPSARNAARSPLRQLEGACVDELDLVKHVSTWRVAAHDTVTRRTRPAQHTQTHTERMGHETTEHLAGLSPSVTGTTFAVTYPGSYTNLTNLTNI